MDQLRGLEGVISKFEKPATSRRRFLKTTGSASLLAGLAPATYPRNAKAQQKTLRILRWKNFVPAFEVWFNEVFVREWGEQNDTNVIIDNVGLGEIGSMAAAEAKAGEGHDLALFLAPPAALEDYAIDHRDIFEECQNRYGNVSDAILRSNYNPKTDKYYAFCESFVPTVLTYRQDLWDAVGKSPTTWDNIRKGGRAIKLLHEAPVGISLGREHNSRHSFRAIMYAFGASVQDANNNVVLNSSNTLEALKFGKALYDEAMTPDMLSWDPAANNRFMLSGSGCLTVDTMSIIRAAENKQLPVNQHLALAALPQGPAGRVGPMFGVNSYAIWRFANNISGAKKFLLDYIGRFQEGIIASGFQNMPSFPGSVPNLAKLIGSDSRYSILSDVPATMVNFGTPGFYNAAIDEVRRKSIIQFMFAQVATGRKSPQDALDQANKAILPIFEKWREAGKI